MAIHKKGEGSSGAAARLLVESRERVELAAAGLDEEGASIEREVFRKDLTERFDALKEGGCAEPAPMLQSDSIFVIDGETKVFCVRIWHTDKSRTHIARLHVLSCLPLAPNVKINIGDRQL